MCISRITVQKRYVTIEKKDGSQYTPLYNVAVKCGKCYQCVITKANDFAFRTWAESRYHDNKCFATLTYDPKHLPRSKRRFPTLLREHLRDFVKRLRYYNDGERIYFFACGEYGSNTFRPHYHICVMGLKDNELIRLAWTMGHVHIDRLTPRSAAYTAKYMQKDKKIPMFKHDDRLPEFHMIGDRLGESYTKDLNVIQYHRCKSNFNKLEVYFNDRFIQMPKYIREKIFPSSIERSLQTNHILSEIADSETKEAERVKKLYGDKISYKDYKFINQVNNIPNKFKHYNYVKRNKI